MIFEVLNYYENLKDVEYHERGVTLHNPLLAVNEIITASKYQKFPVSILVEAEPSASCPHVPQVQQYGILVDIIEDISNVYKK